MKQCTTVVAVLVALVGLSTMAMADEKADQAIKELDQQFSKVKSYTAAHETMTDTEFGPGYTQKMEMTGTSEWLRKGEQALMHSVSKCQTTKTEGGQTTTTPSTITTVNDGEFLYTLTEENGQKTVMKNSPQSSQVHQPKSYFEMFKSYYDIKLLPNEKVNGEDCYVFELKMKPMEGVAPSGRQLVYFQKSHGIQIKSEAFDANGKLIVSSLTKDLKINPDINPDRFKFKVPEGAQVIDNTNPQGQPAQAEPQAEEEESEVEEAEEEKPVEEEKPKKKKGLKLPKWP